LGQANDLYQPKLLEDIYLSTEDRLRHTYILGSTGSGKTRLIENLIRQDILNSRGWGVIDVHGDLSQRILQFVGSLLTAGDPYQLAQHIAKKLVVIEPWNEDFVVGLNFLERKGVDPYMQASEFLGIFKR